MKSTTSLLLVATIGGLMLGGCSGGNATRPANSGPVQGTMGLEKLTVDQQIEKVQNDKSIPDQYKQTYINSIRSKAAGGAPQ